MAQLGVRGRDADGLGGVQGQTGRGGAEDRGQDAAPHSAGVDFLELQERLVLLSTGGGHHGYRQSEYQQVYSITNKPHGARTQSFCFRSRITTDSGRVTNTGRCRLTFLTSSRGQILRFMSGTRRVAESDCESAQCVINSTLTPTLGQEMSS